MGTLTDDVYAFATAIPAGSADDTAGVERQRMTIRTEDGGTAILVPYAPRTFTRSGVVRTWTEVELPGRQPVLGMGGPQLPHLAFDLFLGSPDPDVTVQDLLDTLEDLATSQARVLLQFNTATGGLWRFTALSWVADLLHPVTQEVTRATASVEFTLANDFQPAVGPVTGGKDPAPHGGGHHKGRTYTVKTGDTLGRISNHFYGTPKYWRKIADANGIRRVRNRKLEVGRPLKIPRLKKASSGGSH